MKESDVPQDMNYYKGTPVRDLNYAIDEQGQYKAVISAGWEAKDDALDAAWDDVREQCREILQQIHHGKLSPLAFHAKNNLMTVALLSEYTGIPKRKIKKHLLPRYFQQLDQDTLETYADVMRISVDELLSIPETI